MTAGGPGRATLADLLADLARSKPWGTRFTVAMLAYNVLTLLQAVVQQTHRSAMLERETSTIFQRFTTQNSRYIPDPCCRKCVAVP